MTDNLRKDSAEQELKGVGQQVKGKIQEGVGKLTGNEDMEADGHLNQAGGKIREKVGEAGQDVADVIDRNRDKR
jgi:uncharacterized protein YjbJ (UPF0337 family)